MLLCLKQGIRYGAGSEKELVSRVKSIGISEFKSRCIAILKKLHRTGSPLVVTLRGRPLVKIEAVGGRAVRRRLGALRNLGEIRGDIVEMGFADDWESGQ